MPFPWRYRFGDSKAKMLSNMGQLLFVKSSSARQAFHSFHRARAMHQSRSLIDTFHPRIAVEFGSKLNEGSESPACILCYFKNHAGYSLIFRYCFWAWTCGQDLCYANSREIATTRVNIWLVRNDSTRPILLITQEENHQHHLLCQVTLYTTK